MLTDPKQLRINDFDFDLPESAIARFPIAERDLANLLVYRNAIISDLVFKNVPELLHENDLLILNNTRVIPARLFFKKATGGELEILCLEPVGCSHQDAMSAHDPLTWTCMVGGAKKWKNDEVLRIELNIEENEVNFFAKKLRRNEHEFLIEFSWDNSKFVFSEILLKAGEIPLPPYLNRNAEASDVIRYQTVFAKEEGSVAAPTAGLHFTTELLQRLALKGICHEKLTLHVGAGTFKPVSSTLIADHAMHGEIFSIDVKLLHLLKSDHGKRIIAVGTTSVRTLESIYWIGHKLKSGLIPENEMPSLNQWEPYEIMPVYTLVECIDSIITFCERRNQSQFHATTSIMIAPGFHFRICKGMFTNFHLPKSTLLLLVSAFVGADWKKIYDHALSHSYRFLSYGDSSLLLQE
jgi:S-adenosylmethionine:tRNA ribosyltransferase-isomerase